MNEREARARNTGAGRPHHRPLMDQSATLTQLRAAANDWDSKKNDAAAAAKAAARPNTSRRRSRVCQRRWRKRGGKGVHHPAAARRSHATPAATSATTLDRRSRARALGGTAAGAASMKGRQSSVGVGVHGASADAAVRKTRELYAKTTATATVTLRVPPQRESTLPTSVAASTNADWPQAQA